MNAPVSIEQFAAQLPGSAFRSAMRQLASGVSVITVGTDADRSGMTATSVVSLSIDPPSLLVAVNKSSSTWPLLLRHQAFGVNILRAEQRAVAIRFSDSKLAGTARFGEEPTITAKTGAPLLENALAIFDCEVESLVDYRSHVIVIGQVKASRISEADAALLYWRGGYFDVTAGGTALPFDSASAAEEKPSIYRLRSD